jgi:hypothetical protein
VFVGADQCLEDFQELVGEVTAGVVRNVDLNNIYANLVISMRGERVSTRTSLLSWKDIGLTILTENWAKYLDSKNDLRENKAYLFKDR